MDGICSAVLNKIYALGAPGRYFIVSSDEFFEGFPEDNKRDEAELKRALKTLTAQGFIDVKYSSGNMYCVALLKEYTEESPAPPEESDDDLEEYYTDPQINCARIFWAALAGGALGSAVISIIFFLFKLL